MIFHPCRAMYLKKDERAAFIEAYSEEFADLVAGRKTCGHIEIVRGCLAAGLPACRSMIQAIRSRFGWNPIVGGCDRVPEAAAQYAAFIRAARKVSFFADLLDYVDSYHEEEKQ